MGGVNPRVYDDIVAAEQRLLELIKQEWETAGPYRVAPNNFRLARTLGVDVELPAVVLGVSRVEFRYFLNGVYPIVRGAVFVLIPWQGTAQTVEALYKLGSRVAGVLLKHANTDLWTDLTPTGIEFGQEAGAQPPRWESVEVRFTLRLRPRTLNS